MPTMTLPSNEATQAIYEKNDKFESVSEEVVEEWRWGNIYESVILEKETGKYWSVTYRVQSGDHYYHEFEDLDEVEFYQVEPHEKTTVEYIKVKD